MCERFFYYKVEIFLSLRFCIFYLLWIRFYLFVYVDKYLENIFLIFINLKLFKIKYINILCFRIERKCCSLVVLSYKEIVFIVLVFGKWIFFYIFCSDY